jgi:uncharacterized membrane protein YhaH (DUF805 family)
LLVARPRLPVPFSRNHQIRQEFIVHWYMKVLRQYSDFRGRARRTEYWIFTLVSVLISVALAFVDAVLGLEAGGLGLLGVLYGLAVLLPSLAVGARRLHDTGRSGWWQLIQIVPVIGIIVLIVFLATDGHPGANTYGPDPRSSPAEEHTAAIGHPTHGSPHDPYIR